MSGIIIPRDLDAGLTVQAAGLGELRVWLDDDTDPESVNRIAGDGWVHVLTAPQAIWLLDTGRVVELTLDNDLGDDARYGQGKHVVDYLCEQQFAHGRSLWPAEGIVLHTANSEARDQMARAISRHASEVRRSLTGDGKPRFTFG